MLVWCFLLQLPAYAANPSEHWVPFNPNGERRSIVPDGPDSNKYGLDDPDQFSLSEGGIKWGVLMEGPKITGEDENSRRFEFSGLTKWSSETNLPEHLFLVDLYALTPPFIPFPNSTFYTRVSGGGDVYLGNESEVSEAGLLGRAFSLYRELNFEKKCFSLGALDQDGYPIKIDLDPTDKKVIVFAHGWNPASLRQHFREDSLLLLNSLFAATHESPEWEVRAYHWEADADTGSALSVDSGSNGTLAAENGHLHGLHMGEMLLLQTEELEKVHLIGYSAGAWCVRSAARYIRSHSPETQVQVTLLDAFVPNDLPGKQSDLRRYSMADLSRQTGGVPPVDLIDSYYSKDLVLGTQARFFSSVGGFFDFRVDVDHNGQNNSYNGHSGPVRFYTDTVIASSGPFPSGLADVVDLDIGRHGWFQSLYSKENDLPSSPLNVSAILDSPYFISVIWDDSNFSETGFRVERKIGEAEWIDLGTVPANTTLFHDSTVVPDSEYYYRVSALKDDFSDDPSPPGYLKTGPELPDLHFGGEVFLDFEELDGTFDFLGFRGELELIVDFPLRVPISIRESKIGEPDLKWDQITVWDNPALAAANGATILSVLTSGGLGPALIEAPAAVDALLVNVGPTEREIPGSLDVLTITSDEVPGFELGLGVTGTLRFDVTIPTGAAINLNQTAILESLTLQPNSYLNGRADMVVKQSLLNLGSIEHLGGTIHRNYTNYGSSSADLNLELPERFRNFGEFRLKGGRTIGGNSAATSGSFHFEGGTFDGESGLLNTGDFYWSGGTADGFGIVNRSESFEIFGATHKYIKGDAALHNHGIVEHRDDGELVLSHEAEIRNLAAGEYRFPDAATFSAVSDPSREAAGYFLNQGIVSKTGSGTVLFQKNGNDRAEFRNDSGVVDVAGGILSVGSGGWTEAGTFIFSNGGLVALSGPAESKFGFRGVNRIQGSGTMQVVNAETQGLASIEGGDGGATLRIDGRMEAAAGNELLLRVSSNDGGKVFHRPAGIVGGDGRLDNYGAYDWDGGIIFGSAFRNQGDEFSIGGADRKHLLDDAVFSNLGKVTHKTDVGELRLRSGAEFHNLVGSVYEMQGQGVVGMETEFSFEASARFVNSGILRKTGVGVFTIRNNGNDIVEFHNEEGRVEIEEGQIIVTSGGVSDGGVFSINSGGTMIISGSVAPPFTFKNTNSVSGEGRMVVSGMATSEGDASLVGDGVVEIGASGLLRVNGQDKLSLSLTGANASLRLNKGAIGGDGVVENTGNFEWIEGGFTGSAFSNVSDDFSISGDAFKDIFNGGSFTNYGTVHCRSSSGRLRFRDQSVFLNEEGARVILEGAGIFEAQGNAGGTFRGTFQNEGVLEKKGGGEVVFRNSGDDILSLENGGTIEVSEGTITVSADFTQEDGTLRLAGGTFSFGNYARDIDGGVIEGFGTLAGHLTTGALIKPLGTGIFFPGSLTQSPAGILQATLGEDSFSYVGVNVNGPVELSGKALISRGSGIRLSVGDRFRILSASTIQGNFTEIITGRSMAGYTYEVESSSTFVEVVITGVPDFDATIWRLDTFTLEELGNEEISGYSSDPDLDGDDNLIEYITGSDPNADSSRSSAPIIASIVEDGISYMEISYTQLAAVQDAEIIVESSPDLTSWNDSESLIERTSPAVISGDGFTKTYTVRFDTSEVSEEGYEWFFRLKGKFIED